MSTHSSQETYARSIEVCDKWSLEHDYPHFYSNNSHMDENVILQL